jgi:ABC transporter substrate binding protein
MLDGRNKNLPLLVEIIASVKQGNNMYTIPTPRFDLVEIAVVCIDRVVSLLVGPSIRHRLCSGRAGDMERALDKFAREPNGGVIETASVSGTTHRQTIISAVMRLRLPAVYPFRYYVLAGGLASYGPDPIDQFKRAAKYVDRILKGAKPSELPVQTPTKYELVLNLKAAKALGLEMPSSLLITADEVIE